MSARARRTLGLFAVMIGLALYCILVMRLAILILPLHWAADLVFYLITGLAWIFPAYAVLHRTGKSDGED